MIQAAYKVVGRKGYSSFTIRDIAVEAGLSTGLVHYYFQNKEDLLLSLFKDMHRNVTTYLKAELEHAEGPEERLRVYLDQAFSLTDREGDYFYILFDFWSQIKHNERIRKVNIRLFRSFREELSVILQEGLDKGVFADLDVAYTVTEILAVIQGVLVQYVIDRNTFDYKAAFEKMKDKIMAMVLKAS